MKRKETIREKSHEFSLYQGFQLKPYNLVLYYNRVLKNRCSVAKSRSTHCDLDYGMPGSSVFQYLSEFAQFMSIESVMLSNHLILCHLLLLLPSVFPSVRVFCNESVLHIRWPEYWSFSFSISPSNEYSGLISLGLTGLISLLSEGLSRVFPSTTNRKNQFFSAQPSLWFNSQIRT